MFGVYLKQIKWLFCLVTFCLFWLTSSYAVTTKSVPSFNLSEISNTNISDLVRYYSLNQNASMPPTNHSQVKDWLNTLNVHKATNSLGDKYVATFKLFNDTQQSDWFVYPYGSVVQTIQIISYSDGQRADYAVSGHGLDNQQDFHYGTSLRILPGQYKTVLLIFDSEFYFSPIKILLKPMAQAEQQFKIENVILLLNLGICFALGVYNLFIYQSTRDNKYLSYALATLAFAFCWSSVFAVPQYVGLEQADHWLMPAFLLATFFSSLFYMQFLRLKDSSPKTTKILTFSAYACLISIPLAFYSQGIGMYLVTIISSVVLLTSIFAGISCWKKGYTPAKYFVLALFSMLLPNMIGNLMNLGVLPGLNINIYLLGFVGNSLDSLLLAFALAAHVRVINQDNIKLTDTLESTVQQRTTELRQANFKLEQSNGELIEANNAKGRFLATMSHEIRTPLTSIIGYADGILLGDIDKAEQQRVLKIIAENGNHLLEVINDILDISKIEANKLEFESIPTALFSVLAQIESVVSKRASDKGLAFHLEYQYPLPAQVYTDPTRLKQILFNLTNNAIKFTEQGFVGLSVKFVESRLQIEVKDSGEGISKQQIERLFTPFTQADSSINRRFGGTGLGLSISQQLAYGMGGDVKVDSTPRRGSVFTLDIPLALVDNTPWINNVNEIWQSTPVKTIKSNALPNFAGCKVLLADDHPNNRELISILLKRMNIEVTEVENGKQALETIFYQTFDLILLDIHMPKMDGSEAIKHIRESGNITPVIALTANNMKHEIEHYKRLGFSDHLAKPIARDIFISKLSLYLTKQGEVDAPLQQEDMSVLIRDYQQELIKQISKVQQALEQRDLTLIADYAHRIKGSAGTFGFGIVGDKFANIEHCALQDDEIAVTYELPKVLILAKQCTELPGVDITKGIGNHHNSVEQLLVALYGLIENSEQDFTLLTQAINSRDFDNAKVYLDSLIPTVISCGLVRSESAFRVLQSMLNESSEQQQDYTKQLNIIQAHLTELSIALQPNLLEQI